MGACICLRNSRKYAHLNVGPFEDLLKFIAYMQSRSTCSSCSGFDRAALFSLPVNLEPVLLRVISQSAITSEYERVYIAIYTKILLKNYRSCDIFGPKNGRI